jgi:uncharacterized membrane protein
MSGAILNAGIGSEMAVGDIARFSLTLAGESFRPVVEAACLGQTSYFTFDITKTRSVLNWPPVIDISAGLFSFLGMNKNDE